MRFGVQGRIPMNRQPYNGDAHVGGRGQAWNQGDRGRNRDHDRDGDGDRRRRTYWRGYNVGLGYGYLGWPGYPFLWNDPGLYGYDNMGYDNDQASYEDSYGPVAPSGVYQDSMEPYPGYAGAPAPYNYGEGGSYGSPAMNEPQGARAPYSGSSDVAIPAAPQQTVTVVYNDGRPSEQIYNYLITPTTLTVLDHKYREIPLDKINLAATQETNRADGVDFRVPQPSR
jgi:hypothetical protein